MSVLLYERTHCFSKSLLYDFPVADGGNSSNCVGRTAELSRTAKRDRRPDDCGDQGNAGSALLHARALQFEINLGSVCRRLILAGNSLRADLRRLLDPHLVVI